MGNQPLDRWRVSLCLCFELVPVAFSGFQGKPQFEHHQFRVGGVGGGGGDERPPMVLPQGQWGQTGVHCSDNPPPRRKKKKEREENKRKEKRRNSLPSPPPPHTRQFRPRKRCSQPQGQLSICPAVQLAHHLSRCVDKIFCLQAPDAKFKKPHSDSSLTLALSFFISSQD